MGEMEKTAEGPKFGERWGNVKIRSIESPAEEGH